MRKAGKMGAIRTNRETPDRGRRAEELSPDIREFLRMLQAMEDRPGTGRKDDGEPR